MQLLVQASIPYPMRRPLLPGINTIFRKITDGSRKVGRAHVRGGSGDQVTDGAGKARGEAIVTVMISRLVKGGCVLPSSKISFYDETTTDGTK